MNLGLWVRQLFCKHQLLFSEIEVKTDYVTARGRYLYAAKVNYRVTECKLCGLYSQKKIG